MEAVKRGSLSGLLYREFYLARKELIGAFLMFLGVALFCLLILLSFEFGNLGRVMNSLLDGMRTEETRQTAMEGFENAKNSMLVMVKLLPVVMGCQFGLVVDNVTARDELVSWQRFSRCTPVTPQKRALTKTLMNGACCIASMLLGFIYMNIISLATGSPVTASEYSVAFCAVTGLMIFAVAGQIYIMIFHSADKGYLALLATVMVPIWISAAVNMNTPAAQQEDTTFDDIVAFCNAAAPFIPLIIIGVLALSFVTLTALYSRREA